jgi:hypothetical protein
VNRQTATLIAAGLLAGVGLGSFGLSQIAGTSSKPAIIAFAAPVDTTVIDTTTSSNVIDSTSVAEPSSTIAADTTTSPVPVSTTAPKGVQAPASSVTTFPTTIAPVTTFPPSPPTTSVAFCTVGKTTTTAVWFGFTGSWSGTLTITTFVRDGISQAAGQTVTITDGTGTLTLDGTLFKELHLVGNFAADDGSDHPSCLSGNFGPS